MLMNAEGHLIYSPFKNIGMVRPFILLLLYTEGILDQNFSLQLKKKVILDLKGYYINA